MMPDIEGRHGIHVVDDRIPIDLVTFDAQITAVVSYDDEVAKIPPFLRGIKLLIHPTVETEGWLSHSTVEAEVFEPLSDRTELLELSVRPSHRNLEALDQRRCALRSTHPCTALQLGLGTRLLPVSLAVIRFHDEFAAVRAVHESNRASGSA